MSRIRKTGYYYSAFVSVEVFLTVLRILDSNSDPNPGFGSSADPEPILDPAQNLYADPDPDPDPGGGGRG
jgi:hypothetical protein